MIAAPGSAARSGIGVIDVSRIDQNIARADITVLQAYACAFPHARRS